MYFIYGDEIIKRKRQAWMTSFVLALGVSGACTFYKLGSRILFSYQALPHQIGRNVLLCSIASTWEFWRTQVFVFLLRQVIETLCLFQTFFGYDKSMDIWSTVFLWEITTKPFGGEFADTHGKDHKLSCWTWHCPPLCDPRGGLLGWDHRSYSYDGITARLLHLWIHMGMSVWRSYLLNSLCDFSFFFCLEWDGGNGACFYSPFMWIPYPGMVYILKFTSFH